MPSEHRLHPYAIISRFVSQVRAFVVPALLVLVGARSWDNDWEPWLLVLVIPNAIVAVVRYASFRYRYEPSELVIRTGVLFRNERHMPYARIQNIDAVQGTLHTSLWW